MEEDVTPVTQSDEPEGDVEIRTDIHAGPEVVLQPPNG
jgi:hypothetical protein